MTPYAKFVVDPNEQAAYDLSRHDLFVEIQSRHRRVQMLNRDLKFFIDNMPYRGHPSNSELFNPELTVILPIEKLLSDKQIAGGPIPIRVYSDGRRAWVKVLRDPTN
jgi:hypothetical protein